MANEVACKIRGTSHGQDVSVEVTLYGVVSEARYDVEQKIARYRADQLTVTWPRPQRHAGFRPHDRRAMGLGADKGGERFDNIDWED